MSFIDNLKKTAGQIANKTQEVVKDASDSTKLRLNISAKKKEIQEKYIALGKKVFEDFEAGTLTDDSFAEDVGIIQEAKKAIIGLEEQLAAITPITETLKEEGGSVLGKIKDKVSETYESTKDYVEDKVEDAKDYVERRKDQVEDYVDGEDDVVDEVEGAIEDVTAKAEEAWGEAKDVVEDKWQDAKDVAEDTWNEVEDTAQEVANQAEGFAEEVEQEVEELH